MVDPNTAHLWANRILYLACAFLLIFLHLLPLQTTPASFAAPDFLICLTAAWVLRRPEQVPVLSVAFVFLMADLFFQNPPGLTTALVVLATEFLRSRSPFLREYPFAVEWLIFAVVAAAISIGLRLVLLLLVVPPPPVWLAGTQFVATVLAYPVMVAFLYLAVGVGRRYLTTGERRIP